MISEANQPTDHCSRLLKNLVSVLYSTAGVGSLRHTCHTWHAEAPCFTYRFLLWFTQKV